MNEEIFKYFAPYYDLLYSNKNYQLEIDYLESIFKEFAAKGENIINFACGTGKHDNILAGRGYKVTGVDRSAEMLNLAKNLAGGKVNFINSDMRSACLNKTFDIALCLFDSINYMLTDSDLTSFLKTVRKHLRPEGIFIFDSWNGDAVIKNPPSPQTRVVEKSDCRITRSSCLSLVTDKNQVTIDYTLQAEDLINGSTRQYLENHTVRYFFADEIKKFAVDNCFEILRSSAWLGSGGITESDWNICFILKAK